MDPRLRARLLWLMAVRVVVVTVLLGAAVLVQIKSPGSLPVNPFFFVIGFTYALTAVYALLLKPTTPRAWVADLQLACDAVLASALVWMTGGTVSYFTTLYTLPIIAAAMLRPRGGLVVGGLEALLYGAIVAAQYAGLAFQPVAALPPLRIALFTTGLNLFGFLAVALLSGYLADGLRRADAQLQQTSTRLADLQAFSQHIIDSLAAGLATTSAAGVVTSFNRAAEAITGVPAAAAIGRPIAAVLQLPPSVAGFFAAPEEAVLPRAEFEFRRPGGHSIELGLSTAALQAPRPGAGYIVTFRDVTEVRRREREARIQHRLAAVGEMAAGIAHEIRNPLASMSGSIQILRQELPLTDEQAQLMDIVMRESERLNETIRSFLAYARPQRQPSTRVDVRRVLTDASTLLQNSPERHEAHEIDVDVPDVPVVCLADENQIRQIVWNLTSNALRAMPEGGHLTLRVTEEAQAGHLALSVSDTGVGIAPDDLDTILHPFRGGFAKGTGLGLSIVHRLVSDYGGELLVSSQPGAGTTVTVRLPLADHAAVAPLEALVG